MAILMFHGLRPESIVDFGCGTGSWLAEAQRATGADILGIDGPWTEDRTLEIGSGEFRQMDLTLPIDLGRRFDLGLSVEVAEHLPPAAARILVGSIVAHTDRVVFSAAIPGQGGMGHVNEQWPDYWSALFQEHGFRCDDLFRHLGIDCLRKIIPIPHSKH